MIDSIPSQLQVHKLLQKNNISKQEQEQLILAIKKGCYDMPDVVFSQSYQLIKNKQNTSDQKYSNLQELIENAIRIKIPLVTIKKYIQTFVKDIGKTRYIEKLSAFANFVFNKENNQKEELQNLVKQDLGDLNLRKMLLTAYKREGRIDDYVKRLNSFLEENPSDSEAWVELSRIYTEKGLYLRALFCMQEVIVLHPENQHYMVKLAQLYVTLGGKDDIKNAIKYFAHVVSKYPRNIRALWGLYRTLNSLGDKLLEPEYIELKQLCNDTLNKQYSKKNPKLKIHIAL